MSDTVLAGVLGALLSKTGVAATGGRDATLGADGENGEVAATLFGAFYNDAESAQARQLTPTFETGVFLKRPPKAALAHVVPTEAPTLPYSPPSLTPPTPPSFAPATIETADVAQPSLFAGNGVPNENYKELIFVRAEDAPKTSPVNPLVTNVSDLPAPAAGRAFAETYANFEKGQYDFSTVKLSRPPAENVDPTQKNNDPIIKTIKEGVPVQLASAAADSAVELSPPSIDVKKLEARSDYTFATPRNLVRAFASFDGAPQFRESYLTLTPEIDLPLDAQPPKLDAPIGGRSAEAAIATPLQAPAQTAFLNAFGNFAALTQDVAAPILASDVDITFDPALAPTSTSTTAAGAPTLTASSSAPTPAALAGVLPQIQAAVSTRHGRETVEVRLDPPDLGRLRIEFNVENGDTIKAVLSAERSETLDFLKRNIVDLENQLKQAGFASIDFEFSDTQRQFDADDTESSEFDAAQLDGAPPLDLRQKIYLSPREFARLDLLL